ncbi:trimethylamine corrinoid protein [Desulfocicer vacuolatum DSM 3385]|uniref:Trimethylamine corrinoid protein n=1 Tax=Desulfocicer vacuolatum DSM 3385 TaxID=1121400 RepID=A0A1W2DLF3_9BACT|nr:corrinoid protein [Desulfocicer vacuolatum]SMC97858.1 trimethylamine corrinoid protein [Desulfocicer vacuolatum DSM 3385]
MTTEIYEQAMESIVKGDAALAEEMAQKGLGEGIEPIELINNGFIPGINKVGELFGMGTLFLPELIQAATAMQTATELINDAIPDNEAASGGRIIIGTVAGDVHDIGKTIVVSLFKANGFEVKDLGRDVSVEQFIEGADKFNADIIGTSALLTTTMPEQKKLEESLKKAGLKSRFKTMVGGAPVTRRWAKRIGADAFAENAGDGVRLARELLAG